MVPPSSTSPWLRTRKGCCNLLLASLILKWKAQGQDFVKAPFLNVVFGGPTMFLIFEIPSNFGNRGKPRTPVFVVVVITIIIFWLTKHGACSSPAHVPIKPFTPRLPCAPHTLPPPHVYPLRSKPKPMVPKAPKLDPPFGQPFGQPLPHSPNACPSPVWHPEG